MRMFERDPLSARSSVKVALITFLVLSLLTAAVLFSLPRTFVAVTRIEVRPSRLMAAEVHQGEAEAYNPYFIEREIERIKSEPVLSRAVMELQRDPQAANFGKAWHTAMDKEARGRALRSHLDVRHSRNTYLIEIRFSDRNPQHAALISDNVAYAYSSVAKSQVPIESRVIDRARPPLSPASPNVPQLLVFATGLNVLLSVFAGFFASNLFR